MRYLFPVLCFALAGFVWYYNSTHTDSYLLFPFLDAVPPLRGDLDAQSTWSSILFASIGAIALIGTVIGDLRRRPSDE